MGWVWRGSGGSQEGIKLSCSLFQEVKGIKTEEAALNEISYQVEIGKDNIDNIDTNNGPLFQIRLLES